ncbi:MAG TPA: nucleotidyltransferase [Exilispira sp.]|nr:nucleotidyltransferase [Exilispira sp.]
MNDPVEFIKKTMVIPAIDEESGIRIDIIFSFSEYEKIALERVKKVEIDGVLINYISLEDLIIHKIISGRARDLEDIKNIMLKNEDIDEKYINLYARKDSRVLSGLIIIEVILFFLYIFKIDFIIYFNFIIPDFIRFLAILSGIFGVFIIGWASFTLDGEFSETIELKEGHRLITNGPYKYIRHPIYSGFIILHLGVTIALSNLIIFIIYNMGLLVLLIERIPKEEKVLNLYFGKNYEDYCKKAGRFIPKIRNNIKQYFFKK